MNYLFLNLKKTFLTLFLGISLLFGTQTIKAATITSTAAGGDWNSTSTWVGGVVPANSTADYVIIVGTATVTLNLTANFTVGALDINQGGRLNVSQDATARTFTLGILPPGSTIAGALLFDASVTGSKSFGKVTVTASGSVIETTRVSISINNGANGVLTNYGTVTTGTLAMSGTSAALMNIYNYGTINSSTGFSSTTIGTFTNYSTGIFNHTGTVAGTINNFGTINSTSLSGSAATAIINNKATGVLNYTGATMSSTTLVLTASEAGNTVNYNLGGTQTVKNVVYSNLILSNSGTKTIGTAASGTLCTGKMTISGTAKANLTNINLGVNLLFLGTTGQAQGTIGFTGSGATTINTAYFTTGTGSLNVQQTYSITSTAVGGDWNSTSTWVDGVVPANSSADYVTIVGTATVNLTLTVAFNVGALNINQGGTLNVSGNNGFAIASRSPFSEIAGTLNLDATTGSKSFGNLTVAASGVINSLGASTSVGSSATTPWVNNGTITMTTLGLTTAKTINNNGTFTCTGIGSTSAGTFTNYSSGVFNYSGSYIPPAVILTTTATGNTVNYNGTYQTVFPVYYNNLILSNTATKTLFQSADTTVSNLTINSGVILKVTSASVNSVTISSGGSGYATVPTVTFTAAPTGGTTATGTAILSGGVVSSIAISNPGSGYASVPMITFGSGVASATAAITALPTAYKFTVTETTTNNGTLTFDTFAGIGNKTFTTFNNSGDITSSIASNFEFTTANYSKAGDQTILAGSYNNLSLSGSGSKNVASGTTLTIPINGTLTVNSGITLNNSGIIDNSGTIINNGDLILKSSATGTASLLSSSAVANVTQQRYLSSNQRGWRLISNPLSSTTFDVLATASTITLGTNFTGEYLSASNTWTSTNGAAAMDNNKAYKIFITGLAGESPTYATGPSNVTLVNKGTAANTAPAAIATVVGKYYLVANPYTAPVSVASILAASTGLSSTISYYNPTNASTDVKVKFGGYDFPIVSGVAGSATDVVIPPMGAIFVQATIDGSISIPKTAIFTGTPAQTNTYNHRTTQTNLTSDNALKLEVSSGSVYYDTLALQFKAAGESGSNLDFGKLPNTILEADSLVGTQKMAVSELELIAQTIPLGITTTIQKNYTFKVTDNTITSGFEAVLVDNVLNTNTVLNPGTNYDFVIDSTPANQGNSRFAINLRTSSLLGANSNELETKIKVYPNPSRGHFNISSTLEAAATIEISSIDGQMIHCQKLNSGTTTIQTNSWATGVYILKATNNGTQITKKLVIQ